VSTTSCIRKSHCTTCYVPVHSTRSEVPVMQLRVRYLVLILKYCAEHFFVNFGGRPASFHPGVHLDLQPVQPFDLVVACVSTTGFIVLYEISGLLATTNFCRESSRSVTVTVVDSSGMPGSCTFSSTVCTRSALSRWRCPRSGPSQTCAQRRSIRRRAELSSLSWA
jgi:hypothetical protein